MKETHAGHADRFDVRSADGTSLAVWVDGSGPPLVLVHGSVSDHTTFDPFVDDAAEDLTTFSMDRRGFGASGDAPGYSIERDFEDVAAVVDAVAARTGGPVALWGHSYGANCAMGGAALTNNVHHLVLYEPSLGLTYPPGSIEAIERAVAAGDLEAAIVTVFVDILEMTEEEIDAMRSSPLWPPASPPRTPCPESAESKRAGYTSRPVRRHHRAHASPGRLRHARRPAQRDPRRRRRDPGTPAPRARRARPHGPQDGPGDGRGDHPAIHPVVDGATAGIEASARQKLDAHRRNGTRSRRQLQ